MRRSTRPTVPAVNETMAQIATPAKGDILARDTTRYFGRGDRSATLPMPFGW